MKIYTKTGDKGKTSLFGGTRVPKYDLRIEAYGTIDELNSYIGLVRDQKIEAHSSEILSKIQHELFTIGSMLATPPEKKVLKNGKERLTITKINTNSIQLLENEIDSMNESLPEMTHFILPGGHTTVSFCHIARCICRRAERICTQLSDESYIEPQILMYLNRLSDYLFVLARKLTIDNNAQEIKWIPEKIK
ncbi:MAG: cob(I)yrinic acid a,c-diamide adenosyltransferase [Lutibacter sp.]|uniref:cob(I)yrinic acid a,c-diamide adenosyltransferase n=1 Tax=Lutibacter sp. TaxID=1925666 RepID=UPI001A0788FE|nr:cob(I)yrinic acid a,c-diamide adenosyltransferase [Lutibacter sp.]NOR28257.1 cob(I)yrinic acid a,c-diamide adenosyltransferase [Lutibacter sp.]